MIRPSSVAPKQTYPTTGERAGGRQEPRGGGGPFAAAHAVSPPPELSPCDPGGGRRRHPRQRQGQGQGIAREGLRGPRPGETRRQGRLAMDVEGAGPGDPCPSAGEVSPMDTYLLPCAR